MNGYPEMAGQPGFDPWGRALPNTIWVGPNTAAPMLRRLFGQAEWDRVVKSAGDSHFSSKPFQLDGDALKKVRGQRLDLEETRIAILAEAFKVFLDSFDPRHR